MANRPYSYGEKSVDMDESVTDYSVMGNQSEQQHENARHGAISRPGKNRTWTPVALLISYIVFSVTLYTILPDEATKVFWFLYLTIATIVASVTALEAYDGLTPLREARNAIAKAGAADWKFKTNDADLPTVDLVFDEEGDPSSTLSMISRVVQEMAYPSNRVQVTILRRLATTAGYPSMHYPRNSGIDRIRIMTLPQMSAPSIAARMSHLASFDAGAEAEITALFRDGAHPHPHAIRHAVERLVADKKVDVVQGRNIMVPPTGRLAAFACVPSLENDLLAALLKPGRYGTWQLFVAYDSCSFWRTEILRGATSSSGTVTRDAQDLGFASFARGSRAVPDLKVVSYSACPSSLSDYWTWHVERAGLNALATVRYARLAFTKQREKGQTNGKRAMKIRFAILYTLPILQIASHAIVQYFCMALALVITKTPTSVFNFAATIYFPYPISEWFMIFG